MLKKRFLIASLALSTLLVATCVTGCSSEETAAKYEGGTIAEAQVTAYTEQYRAENDLEDDVAWSQYLVNSGQDASTWRESAIRQLVQKDLVQKKAEELGISADESVVEEQISADKKSAGVDESDDSAWETYLADQGKTPQGVRESYEFSSIEQQVFTSELNLTSELEEEMCDEYIAGSLADQIVHRYSCLVFTNKTDAQKTLDSLLKLKSDELASEFESLIAESTTTLESTGAVSCDLDWDFIYSEGVVDPKIKLRKANLSPGQLYQKVLKGTDGYRVILCTGKGDFYKTPKYSQIQDEDLKSVIHRLTLASTWASKCQQYLNELVEAADVQVSTVPEGLPYDTVEESESSQESGSDNEG